MMSEPPTESDSKSSEAERDEVSPGTSRRLEAFLEAGTKRAQVAIGISVGLFTVLSSLLSAGAERASLLQDSRVRQVILIGVPVLVVIISFITGLVAEWRKEREADEVSQLRLAVKAAYKKALASGALNMREGRST